MAWMSISLINIPVLVYSIRGIQKTWPSWDVPSKIGPNLSNASAQKSQVEMRNSMHGATRKKCRARLEQDNIVLFRPIARLSLERNGFADKIRRHRQGLLFLFEKQINDLLAGDDTIFARHELT